MPSHPGSDVTSVYGFLFWPGMFIIIKFPLEQSVFLFVAVLCLVVMYYNSESFSKHPDAVVGQVLPVQMCRFPLTRRHLSSPTGAVFNITRQPSSPARSRPSPGRALDCRQIQPELEPLLYLVDHRLLLHCQSDLKPTSARFGFRALVSVHL